MGHRCQLDCALVPHQHLNNSMNIVWFNGPSSEALHWIPPQELEIGCNFIQKDRSVHHVCAYDRPVMERISPKPSTQCWTRPAMRSPGWCVLHSAKEYFCSGTMAVGLARELALRDVYVIGCDWDRNNISIYDHLYGRTRQPKKKSIPRRRYIEQVHRDIGLVFVSDHRIDMQVDQISHKEFLRKINC